MEFRQLLKFNQGVVWRVVSRSVRKVCSPTIRTAAFTNSSQSSARAANDMYSSDRKLLNEMSFLLAELSFSTLLELPSQHKPCCAGAKAATAHSPFSKRSREPGRATLEPFEACSCKLGASESRACT
eukprot:13430308-Alexandrium_andersonii.AAC.1